MVAMSLHKKGSSKANFFSYFDCPAANAKLTDILVIGGGVAGSISALKLANQGYQVTLLEKNKLFSGTSSKTPGRMGLGFHYADKETAFRCLRATISFAKEFPGFRIGEDYPWAHPHRHGRYFITKDSLFNVQEILSVYEAVKQEYRRLVELDPTNEVFGNADDFFRILSPSEYINDVDMSKVVLGIETPEHLLDWLKFESYISDKLHNTKNLTIYEYTEVTAIHHDIQGQDKSYTVLSKTLFPDTTPQTIVQKFTSNIVVNSTWSNIELLNNELGLSSSHSKRTNRLKVLLEVELPSSLVNKHSMFFCIGPHCMLSNLSNGRALMTYAPVSNIECSNELTPNLKMTQLLSGIVSLQEKHQFMKGIIEGVARYIPDIIHSRPIGLRFGIVQSDGSVDILDPHSDFHSRNYHGVEEIAPGFIVNPAIKLFYCLDNAQAVCETVTAIKKRQSIYDDQLSATV